METLKVTFRAKVQNMGNWQGIKIPRLTSRHVDMTKARSHPKFGQYVNTSLFEQVLNRAAKAHGLTSYVHLEDVPACATVDTSGFLAMVTLEFADWRVSK